MDNQHEQSQESRLAASSDVGNRCKFYIYLDQNVVKEISKLPEMNMPALRKINSDRPDKYAGMDWIFKVEANITTLCTS